MYQEQAIEWAKTAKNGETINFSFTSDLGEISVKVECFKHNPESARQTQYWVTVTSKQHGSRTMTLFADEFTAFVQKNLEQAPVVEEKEAAAVPATRAEMLEALAAEGVQIRQSDWTEYSINHEQEYEMAQILKSFGDNPISFITDGKPGIFLHSRLFKVEKRVNRWLQDVGDMTKEQIAEQAKRIEAFNNRYKA